MICIRLVVSHDDNDVDVVVAIVVDRTLATVVVALGVLSLVVTIQVIAIDASEVAFSK